MVYKTEAEQDKAWSLALYSEHGLCIYDIAEKLERSVGTIRHWIYGPLSLAERVLLFFSHQSPSAKLTALDIAQEISAKQSETRLVLRNLVREGVLSMVVQSTVFDRRPQEFFSYVSN